MIGVKIFVNLQVGSGNGVSIRESPLFFIDHRVVYTNTFNLHGGRYGW
jgi:hypothetical protein